MEFEILTANYNNSQFLDSFFNSINNSFVKPKRIIFVDDCSTDNSIEIVSKFIKEGNVPVKLIENPENMGFANSLNLAISQLGSTYFARLDPDDSVFPERFQAQLLYLERNPDIDLVGTNVQYYLNNLPIRYSDVMYGEFKIKNAIKRGILPIIHGTIMGRSEILKNYKYDQNLVPSEDYDLFAYLIFNNFRLENISDPLTKVTIHSNSVSNDLKYATIKKRYDLAYKYFQYKKVKIFVFLDFYHLLNYRRYLFESSVLKYYYLIVAAACMPFKSIKKVLRIS